MISIGEEFDHMFELTNRKSVEKRVDEILQEDFLCSIDEEYHQWKNSLSLDLDLDLDQSFSLFDQ